MFTGIIEEIGQIKSISKGANSVILEIRGDKIFDDIHIGDSIAVNGICLTVTKFGKDYFFADVMHETLKRSSLRGIVIGSKVNLERAMAARGRFGGHIVSGHVDTIGQIIEIKNDDNAIWFKIMPKQSTSGVNILRYVVEKGSITIDGISLTVADLNDNTLSISAIPHTVAQTILKYKKPGDLVNLEADIIGKYVERLMGFNPTPLDAKASNGPNNSTSNITMDFLIENGF